MVMRRRWSLSRELIFHRRRAFARRCAIEEEVEAAMRRSDREAAAGLIDRCDWEVERLVCTGSVSAVD